MVRRALFVAAVARVCVTRFRALVLIGAPAALNMVTFRSRIVFHRRGRLLASPVSGKRAL
ncbi:hypothetical protein RE6C_03026 [Rhodopirellula europaea 6C]|uniref:Uncharacterized protein n=2 Tax=Rhodopirellula TaxID=265488 RepID=M2AGJ5_9BACT|nr:hypothetical protein RE6C_03026 [Rhodopirellula europaea 6C]